MNTTNDDTNMTGNADNCDPLRTKSGQPVAGTVHTSIAFRSRDEAIACLCQKVFGASPVFPDPTPPTILDNCRNALRDAGKVYPRSGCAVCGDGGLRGCPYEKTPPAECRIDEPIGLPVWNGIGQPGSVMPIPPPAERPTPDVSATIAAAAADHLTEQTDRMMTERPTPITDAEWQDECCSGAPWYRIAERMKNHAADLELKLAEVTRQRDALAEALEIIASGGRGQFQWSMTKAELLARKTLAAVKGGDA